MRAMTIVIPLLLFVSEAAWSQDRSKTGQIPSPTAPPTSGSAILQAPVGHRQPMQSDLPPAARKDEDSAGRKPDPLGPVPNICRNC